MASYVAFLRGINLGPRNKIAMPALRELATGLGYTEVATYINSGNLIFDSTKKAATLEREIAAAIAETFGFRIDVAVRTPAQLKKILADNPYPDGNPSQVTIAFLTKAAPATGKEKVAAIATEARTLHVRRAGRLRPLLRRTRQQQAGREVLRDHRRELDGAEHQHGDQDRRPV